jgi:hypothetical protein
MWQIFWINPDGLIQIGNGALIVASELTRAAAGAVRDGIPRINPDGLIQIGNGALVVAVGAQHREWCMQVHFSDQTECPDRNRRARLSYRVSLTGPRSDWRMQRQTSD